MMAALQLTSSHPNTMKTFSFFPGWILSAGLVCTLAVTPLLAATVAKQLWSSPLPSEAKWHKLTELGTLLVGTDDAILNYDPDSGKLLWT